MNEDRCVTLNGNESWILLCKYEDPISALLVDFVIIDHFKVNGAILPGVQNYWGELKMNSECMEKVGSRDAR